MSTKFHLHVVDGNAKAAAPDAAENSAVLLFAHMTLRCGHLADAVAVSASTTPASVRQNLLLQHPHGFSPTSSSASAAAGGGLSTMAGRGGIADAAESDDTKVLRAAGAVLTGAADADSEEAYTLPYAPLADGEHAAIVPYAYFTTPFAVAEQSLRRAIAKADPLSSAAEASAATPPPYFDLIATTDLTTFEYVLDYYQQLRVRYGGSVCGGRGTKPVGVLHIVADDPSRAARVLQRVLEMVLKRSGWALSADANTEAGGEGEEEAQQRERQQQQMLLQGAEESDGDEDEEAEEGKEGEEGEQAGSAGAGAHHRGARRKVRLDSWVNYVDEAVHVFAQLFGVDVLVALV